MMKTQQLGNARIGSNVYLPPPKNKPQGNGEKSTYRYCLLKTQRILNIETIERLRTRHTMDRLF